MNVCEEEPPALRFFLAQTFFALCHWTGNKAAAWTAPSACSHPMKSLNGKLSCLGKPDALSTQTNVPLSKDVLEDRRKCTN